MAGVGCLLFPCLLQDAAPVVGAQVFAVKSRVALFLLSLNVHESVRASVQIFTEFLVGTLICI